MRIEELFSKTGLDKKNIRLIKFSAASILALVASFLSSCSNNGVKEKSQTTITSTTTYQTEKPQISPQDVVDTPQDFKNKNCGPTPGYPCGTKYYTISVYDFVG